MKVRSIADKNRIAKKAGVKKISDLSEMAINLKILSNIILMQSKII